MTTPTPEQEILTHGPIMQNRAAPGAPDDWWLLCSADITIEELAEYTDVMRTSRLRFMPNGLNVRLGGLYGKEEFLLALRRAKFTPGFHRAPLINDHYLDMDLVADMSKAGNITFIRDTDDFVIVTLDGPILHLPPSKAKIMADWLTAQCANYLPTAEAPRP